MELILITVICLVAGAIGGAVWGKSSGTAARAVLETKLDAALSNQDQNQDLLLHQFEQMSQKASAFIVAPVQENLARLEKHISNSEAQRQENFGGLFEQMRNVAATNAEVQKETVALKNVLRSSSSSRGRWGEVQLRRVVELAGMIEHADFSEQKTGTDSDSSGRADLIVYLPGNTQIPIDAKVPYAAYERAQRSDDPIGQQQLLNDHAKQFRAHVDALCKRAYWEKYTPGVGFCVLFVPGEALLEAALTQDTNLWEYAAEKQILLATPTTLISLLRMASIGWRQEAQSQNAAEIAKAGRELHKRLAKSFADLDKMGRGLRSALTSYNDFVATVDARVMPQAKRLSDMGAGSGNLALFGHLEGEPRALRTAVDEDDDELGEVFELDTTAHPASPNS